MPPPSPFPQTSPNTTNLRAVPISLGHLFAEQQSLFAEQQSFFGRALNGLMSNSARALARFSSAQASIPELFQQHVPDWLKNRRLWKILLAQGVTFGVVTGGLSSVGFGSAGIGAGTLASFLQGALYGGLTPAMPGWFASLTSMGMTGALGPIIIWIGIGAALGVGGYLLWRSYREHGGGEGDEEDDKKEDDDDGEYDYDKEVEDDDKDVGYDIEEDDVEEEVEHDIEEDVEYENLDDDIIDKEEAFYATRLNGEDRDDRKSRKGWREKNFEKLRACQIQQE